MSWIKQYSHTPQITAFIKEFFEGFYRLLLEVDIHIKNKERADELYSHICTIMINIISLEDIDFIGEVSDLGTPVIVNM